MREGAHYRTYKSWQALKDRCNRAKCINYNKYGGAGVTFPNNFLSNSSATIGNTAVTLGSTVSSLGNVTMANVTITTGTINVTSTNVAATTAASVTFANSSMMLVPAGYISVDLNGTVVKVPYYAV